MKQINRIVFILSLIGIIVAIYVLQSFLRQSSILCITGGGCEAVRKSPASYPFGIPVPAFGLVGYICLALLSFLRTLKLTTHNLQLTTKIMLGIAIFGVCFVSWFTYTEVFVIHGICTWCFVSTINMITIFCLLISSQKKHKHA